MGLSIEDHLKRFVPTHFYYPYKIAKEVRGGEPELGLLPDLVPLGCTAIDVGANRGIYSYALAKLAVEVEAFEPNPALASFARRKLPPNVRVHEVALANHEGRETFYLPQQSPGTDSHLLGNLENIHPTLINVELKVCVATLDSFGFDHVGFIKIDVEGLELQVVQGGLQLIKRCRPKMLVELLVHWHESQARIDEICGMFDYAAFILVEGKWMDAREAIKHARLLMKSNNVLFTPKARNG